MRQFPDDLWTGNAKHNAEDDAQEGRRFWRSFFRILLLLLLMALPAAGLVGVLVFAPELLEDFVEFPEAQTLTVDAGHLEQTQVMLVTQAAVQDVRSRATQAALDGRAATLDQRASALINRESAVAETETQAAVFSNVTETAIAEFNVLQATRSALDLAATRAALDVVETEAVINFQMTQIAGLQNATATAQARTAQPAVTPAAVPLISTPDG